MKDGTSYAGFKDLTGGTTCTLKIVGVGHFWPNLKIISETSQVILVTKFFVLLFHLRMFTLLFLVLAVHKAQMLFSNTVNCL